MGRGAVSLLAALLLSGCASLELPSSKNYTPNWAELNNKAQYDKDLQECHWTADNLADKMNAGTILADTGSGATSNGSLAIVNPFTIVGGAAGGLLNGIINGFDLTGSNSIKTLVVCMNRLTAADGSAVMADYHQ